MSGLERDRDTRTKKAMHGVPISTLRHPTRDAAEDIIMCAVVQARKGHATGYFVSGLAENISHFRGS